MSWLERSTLPEKDSILVNILVSLISAVSFSLQFFVHWVFFGLLILLFTDIWEVETKEEKILNFEFSLFEVHHVIPPLPLIGTIWIRPNFNFFLSRLSLIFCFIIIQIHCKFVCIRLFCITGFFRHKWSLYSQLYSVFTMHT